MILALPAFLRARRNVKRWLLIVAVRNKELPMRLTRKTATFATAAALLLVAACGEKTAPEPQNEVTGAAMPDTSQPPTSWPGA